MGEKIRDLSVIDVGSEQIVIELNRAYDLNYKYDIHIQTDNFQLSLKDGDFIKLAAALRYSKTELESNLVICQEENEKVFQRKG